MSANWNSVAQKLSEAGTPELVCNLFRKQYDNLCSGQDAYIREGEIQPATNVLDAESLGSGAADRGRAQLKHAAVLKLNGGLGTSMGLEDPKSLLPVRGDDTFLTLILRQATSLSVPLVLMNSFSTDDQTARAIDAERAKSNSGQTANVMTFLQHQVPKIDAETLEPVEWKANPDLQWCPPGHGDIYAALVTSGTLDRLLEQGRRYLFVSNADNLGATLDPAILGHFAASGKSFLMEVADRTAADRKGGHLARTPDGRLLLREKAQCHPDEETQFQDIATHRYFNTNNLWIDLSALKAFLDDGPGFVSLPTITNRKTVDPKDPSSTPVYQLETAMGAAIEKLPDTDAIRVPRSRFAPVKTTGDLLAVRSDAYEVREDHSVGLVSDRQGMPPLVKLDDRFYKTMGNLEQRILATPSLRHCKTLAISGDLVLAAPITVEGDVTLCGQDNQRSVPAGAYKNGEFTF